MKNRINIVLAILVIGLFTITSCVDRDIDPPTFVEASAADTSTGTVISIAEFKALQNLPEEKTVYELDTNLFVRGVVIGNGESGNLYKKMYIQDIGLDDPSMVQGLEISIDKTSLFTFYPVGQIVYLRCQGFYMGNYGGYPQFGYIDENGEPGRIPTQLVDSAILIHGLPHFSNIPEPKSIMGASGFGANDISRLVKITNVFFQDAGNLYANEGEDYPERIAEDDNGNIMAISTSTYAKFAADTIPSGYGDIVGILGSYNSENLLYIRGLDDVQMYSVVFGEEFTANPTNWLIESITSNYDWSYNSTNLTMKMSGWGSDVANDDWFITPDIDLTDAVTPVLTFKNKRKYEDSGESEPLKIMITENYTGDPSTTSWTQLSANLDQNTLNTASTSWTLSGDIDLSEYDGNIRIGFHYTSSGNGEGTASYWEIDNVNIID